MSEGECDRCGCARGHHLYDCPMLPRCELKNDATTLRRMSGEHAFLNSFHPASVAFEGALYLSVENAFQAAKTLDLAAREPFQTTSPATAKRLGTRVALRPDWEAVKLDVMTELVAAKFSDPELRARLLATAPRALIEGNWWHDNFWGACHCARCGARGANHLGRILMAVRDGARRG